MNTSVKILSDHACLGNIAPVIRDVEEAVAYVRLVLGDLAPEAFVQIMATVRPEVLDAVKTIIKACFGVGV